eukprot:COSAG01_NODE_8368_length_2812_cov_1.442683_1_plen_152_part_00
MPHRAVLVLDLARSVQLSRTSMAVPYTVLLCAVRASHCGGAPPHLARSSENRLSEKIGALRDNCTRSLMRCALVHSMGRRPSCATWAAAMHNCCVVRGTAGISLSRALHRPLSLGPDSHYDILRGGHSNMRNKPCDGVTRFGLKCRIPIRV